MIHIEVIAPAFYPDLARLEYFVKSARKHDVSLTLYGFMEPFKHWVDSHIDACLQQLRKTKSSHVLFTDAVDVIFLAGLAEITEKYRGLYQPPVLIGFEVSGPNFGGWLGERTAMIDLLQLLRQLEGGDPQERLREAMRRDWINVRLDYKRAIFQVVDGSDLEVIQVGNARRIRNNNTGLWPCLLHFAGGYSHPEFGKREQMEPTWKELGYGSVS